MKSFIPLICLLMLIGCTDESHKSSHVQSPKQQWPASKVLTGNGNTFTISLTKELEGLAFKKTDTMNTIYGRALQDVYLMENDSISMTISIVQYNQDVLQKRKPEKLYESAMNTFLHALQAEKSKSMQCSKSIQNTSIKGERTFYSLIDGMTKYYGVSEMYVFNGKMHHIAILSTSKENFAQSQSIALAFQSFMPQ